MFQQFFNTTSSLVSVSPFVRSTISKVALAGLLLTTQATGVAFAAPPPTCDGLAATPVTIVYTPTGATVYGTPGPDVIVGTPLNDLIYGANGDDRICGMDGHDTI